MAEARFVGMLDYLAALKGSKLASDTAKVDALFQACMVDMENAPPVSMDTGTSMLKLLKRADVPEKWREALSDLVQNKVQAGIGEIAVAKEKKTQHCENLPNYFLKGDWDEMAGAQGILKKCLSMAKRMALLGMLSPDESTCVAVVAIAYVVNHQGPMDELRVNPVNALANVRSFKNHIRGMKGFQKCEIRVFPADPSELPEDLFRKAYGQQLPVQCQVDEVAVRFLRDILPARDTHASIRGMCGKPGLQHFQGMSGSSGGSLVQAFQELKNMLNNGEAQAAEVTLLPPRKHKKLLALEGGDGTASAGSAAAFDMAPGASPDSAAKDLAKLEPAKHEQATEPAEALPEVEETEVQEKPGKSKKNVDEMADEIMGALAKPPAAKAKAKGKAKASSKKAAAKKPPAAKKQPAVAHEKAEEPSSKKSKATLPFPGEGPGEPIRYCNVTIYLCPKSMSYRVKLAGEKKDKAFSWKADGAKQTWGRVRQHVLDVAV